MNYSLELALWFHFPPKPLWIFKRLPEHRVIQVTVGWFVSLTVYIKYGPNKPEKEAPCEHNENSLVRG